MKFQDIELEKGLLISLIANPEAVEEVINKLTPEIFTLSDYQKIFRECICKQYYEAGEILKTKTHLYIKNKINKKLADELVDTSYYAPLEIPEMAEELIKLRDKRNMLQTLRDCYKTVTEEDDFQSIIQDKIFKITSETSNKNAIKDAEFVAMKSWKRLAERQEGKAENVIRTGYRSLDGILKLKRAQLTAIGADTSVGKTAFALNVIRKILETSDEPITVFSLEMEEVELMDRLIIQKSKVCSDDYFSTKRRLTETQQKSISYAVNWIHEKPLKIIDERGLTIEEIKTYSRTAYKQFDNKMGVIVVDYLQEIVLSDNNNLTREIGRVVQALRNLAKELDCHLILISQLSRKFDNREDKRPRRSDLRYSAEIEQVSDAIVLLYRPAVYEKREPGEMEPITQTDAEIIIAKQRGGKTGTLSFNWYPEIQFFQDAVDYLDEGYINYLKQEG